MTVRLGTFFDILVSCIVFMALGSAFVHQRRWPIVREMMMTRAAY